MNPPWPVSWQLPPGEGLNRGLDVRNGMGGRTAAALIAETPARLSPDVGSHRWPRSHAF
jgi:hypothetical protein